MKRLKEIPLVTTIREKCRVCYTCVRECPAKAIRIADGQAEVITERCIGCGNCVRVCSQGAKQVTKSIDKVRSLLATGAKVAACLAPSFPAEFTEIPWRRLMGMIRKLGFAHVHEVAFGADLVAAEYRELLEGEEKKSYIATSCPAIVAYVERYHPEMVDHLAPIVSPMVAEARVLREIYGRDVKVVFVGPCVAKKGEASSIHLPDEINAAITFRELREMIEMEDWQAADVEDSDFDGPLAGLGALFSISRGLLQAAGIQEDLLAGQVVTAEGRRGFVDAINEFQAGHLDARLLEVLCCNGCIMGAGMSVSDPLFFRRSRVSQFVRECHKQRDLAVWEADMKRFAHVDLTRAYSASDQRIPVPFEEEIAHILARMDKTTPQDELNCGACGYDTCRMHAEAIFKGLAEGEMCLPNTIEKLKETVSELAVSNDQLASAQEALMQSEKLASMGQLAAGIAHEVNNPLGVVLMYAHLLLDDQKKNTVMAEDLTMIVQQADRCKKIVAGLLDFARQNKVVLKDADLVELITATLRALPAPAGVTVDVQHAAEKQSTRLDSDQIVQVLTNLVTNAYAAMPDGGTLTIATGGDEDDVTIGVGDSGCGIAPENRKRIFDPFFTTKQIGMGTGLGLAVTYGIVKMHRGDIRVESNTDPEAGPTGTTFTITLPRGESNTE